MKTNQIMLRRLGPMTVQQRTDDAYFNATELIRGYNEMSARLAEADGVWKTTEEVLELCKDGSVAHQIAVRKGNDAELKECQPLPKYPQMGVFKNERSELTENQAVPTYHQLVVCKRLDVFLKNRQTEDFIASIARNEGLDVKDVVKTSRARADRGGGTWVHPMLFIDLCMWLDPDFKYKALKFVQDQMLRFRDEAGEAYKALCQAVARITPDGSRREVMAFVGRAINYIMWNTHNDRERDAHATEDDMRRLQEFERRLASLIDDGFITSPDGLTRYLRRQWAKRWNPIK